MTDWTPVDPKDQERIWDIAIALLARSSADGDNNTLEEALQHACAEFYGAQRALRRGVRFYEIEDGEQQLRQVRVTENGTWVKERGKSRRPVEPS